MYFSRYTFLAGTLLQPLLLLLLLPYLSPHGVLAAPQQKQKDPHRAAQDACMMDIRRRLTGKNNAHWTDIGEHLQTTKTGVTAWVSWLQAQVVGRLWEAERGNTDAGFCVKPDTLRRLAVPPDARLREAVNNLSKPQRQVYQQCFDDEYKRWQVSKTWEKFLASPAQQTCYARAAGQRAVPLDRGSPTAN